VHQGFFPHSSQTIDPARSRVASRVGTANARLGKAKLDELGAQIKAMKACYKKDMAAGSMAA
jgi:hypothetical protein